MQMDNKVNANNRLSARWRASIETLHIRKYPQKNAIVIYYTLDGYSER